MPHDPGTLLFGLGVIAAVMAYAWFFPPPWTWMDDYPDDPWDDHSY